MLSITLAHINKKDEIGKEIDEKGKHKRVDMEEVKWARNEVIKWAANEEVTLARNEVIKWAANEEVKWARKGSY